jgi:malonyl-CoA/methylmalonyl-CoA synthetase
LYRSKSAKVYNGGINNAPFRAEVQSFLDYLYGFFAKSIIDGADRRCAARLWPAEDALQPLIRWRSFVQKALTKKLAKFKLPKRVIFVEELPRNAMGKVHENLSRETFGDLFVS